MSLVQALSRRTVAALPRLVRDRRGGVLLLFAILAPLLVVFVMGTIDVSEELTVQQHLQQATDAASLAVSASDAETPSSTEAQLQTIATNYLASDFIPTTSINGGSPVITSFKLCTTTQSADCVNGAVTNTVTISTQVRAPCWAPLALPGVCTGDGRTQLLTATNTSNIGLPTSIQWSFVLDVSGSMIVGATPSDVQKVITWNNVPANWAKLNDSSDGSTPCAFACHSDGDTNANPRPTTSGYAGSDMDQGLTNAHAAGATTRYDVMISAASEAISYIQQQVSGNSQLAQNKYYFNVYSLADKLNNAFSASATQANDWADASAAITTTKLPVGLDTNFSSALQTMTTSSWAGGSGNSYASPKKVVFLVTDGLQSDFYSDFMQASNVVTDSAWASQASASPGPPAWSGHYYSSEYASPIPSSLCSAIKSNGITLAILETPYVPLTGQSPYLPSGSSKYEFYPYENFIRHVIYPGGPNTASTVSTALQNCANTPQLYAQASSTDPTSILAGLQHLVNAFLATNAYLKQ